MTIVKSLRSGEQEGELRQLWSYLWEQSSIGKALTGVVQGCGVTATTPSASGSVVIGVGLANVQPTTGGGAFPFLVSTAETVDVFTANPMQFVNNPRHDIIGIDQTTGLATVLVGTPGAIPTDPTVPSTVVPLALLSHAANAVTIPSGAISDLRSYLTLNVTPTLHRVKISTTADQTLSDAAVTVIDLASSTTAYDVGGMADTANDQIVIKKAGWYVFTLRAAFAFDAGGYRALILLKNGTTVVGDVYGSPAPPKVSAGSSVPAVLRITTEPIQCAVNDTIQPKAVQTAGGTLPLTVFNGMRVVLTATQQFGLQ